MKMICSLRNTAVIFAAVLLFTSCKKDLVQNPSETATEDAFAFKGQVSEEIFYALAGGTILDKISTKDPGTVISSSTITGLQSGESIVGIDFRPATGQLYGLGSTSRLYVINPSTGKATAVGASAFTPALSGNVAGFDFNPTVDRIRVVTSSGQNLRLNPETGTVAAIDGNINGAPGAAVTAVAYTMNMAGAATTTLYDIDITNQKLYKQIPPNDGKLVEVGPLNLKITGNGGFDISPDGLTLALFEVNKKSTLFTINLATGETRILAKYDKKLMYTGIAIPTKPVAYAVDLSNNLLIFNPNNTSAVVTKPITGLNAGESVVGIDFRPVNGQIFAIGSDSRIYTINASSGAATFVAPLSTALSGSAFGVDFNPVVDRIRIVSNDGQNLRVNPLTGATIVDGPLNPGTPEVSAAAYANNFAGTTSTTLFVIDISTGKLNIQSPPNAGTLVEVGNLNLDANSANGFDIGGTSNMAYALLTSGSNTKLYGINTTSGAATALGNFSSAVRGFTIGLGF